MLIAFFTAIRPASAPGADAPPTRAILSISVHGAREWDCARGIHPWVIWRARTGSKVASPVAAGDRILIGTNNEDRDENAAPGGDLGVMMCVAASDGRFLWQTTHPRLGQRKHDIPRMPIMSRPAIDGNRAYYVSNRGELVCVLIRREVGRSDRGPDVATSRASAVGGEILWKLDMVSDLGVYKVEAPDIGNPVCSPLVVDDLVYCITGNGGDFDGVPAPGAPSLIAVNKFTGKVVWSSNAPGKNIVYGQWCSPAVAVVDGKKQILFPGGDGFLYGFEPLTGKLLWKIDLGGAVPVGDPHYRGLGRRNFFVGAPTVVGNTVYVGLDQIPEDNLMKTRRPLYAVELTTRGVATAPRVKWTFDNKNFDGTTASATVVDGKVYVISRSGFLFALNAETGDPLWMSNLEQQAAPFSAPYIHAGRLYVAGEEQLFMFALGPAPRCLGSFEFGGGSFMNSSPVAIDGRLYFGAAGYLWALVQPSPAGQH